MNKTNKRLLAILFSILIITIIGIGSLSYFLSFKTVHFDIKNGVSVAVFKSDDQKDSNKQLGKLDKSGDLKLQEGDYVAFPSGDKYDSKSISFTVSDNMVVTINPEYSLAYRSELLTNELSAITNAISEAHPTIISGFRMTRGSLYEEGQWYATTLIQKTAILSEQGDVYKTVLKKEDGTWKIKATPSLSLSESQYPDIPRDILDQINARQWEPER